jgi:hypothetical protein
VIDIFDEDDIEFYLFVISFLAIEDLLRGDDLKVVKELELEESRLYVRKG